MCSEPLKRKQNEFITLSVTLFCITLVVSILLAVVNHMTADKIAANKEKKLESAMTALLSEAKSFDDISDAVLGVWDEEIKLLNAFAVRDSKNEIIGYCVEVAPNGYSGIIDMMVGIAPSGEILGTSIISLADEDGFGRQIQEAKFRDQFVGKEGAIAIGNGTTLRNGEIALVSGATYSSSGFTDGVNAALKAYKIIVEEGV